MRVKNCRSFTQFCKLGLDHFTKLNLRFAQMNMLCRSLFSMSPTEYHDSRFRWIECGCPLLSPLLHTTQIPLQLQRLLKVTNFRPVLIFVLLKKVRNLILYENFVLLWGPWISTLFSFEALKIIRKLPQVVRMNQFQVKSTKMGTGGKFVTLQYNANKYQINTKILKKLGSRFPLTSRKLENNV